VCTAATVSVSPDLDILRPLSDRSIMTGTILAVDLL